jgi:transcriptional regulator with XRE-family HTH domain
MEIKKQFGDRVRELRNRLNLSQEALANKCKLHRTYIGNVERGEKNISLENIEKISTALEVKMSDLFL